MEVPPEFEPWMEVLQIQRGRASCCLELVYGLSSSPVLARVRALLDYVWTTACTTVNTAIVALTPSAGVTRTVSVSPGVRRSVTNALRRRRPIELS